METYRIEDRQNVTYNARPITMFKYFERAGESFVFKGIYFASGHNASIAACNAAVAWYDDDEEVD